MTARRVVRVTQSFFAVYAVLAPDDAVEIIYLDLEESTP